MWSAREESSLVRAVNVGVSADADRSIKYLIYLSVNLLKNVLAILENARPSVLDHICNALEDSPNNNFWFDFSFVQ